MAGLPIENGAHGPTLSSEEDKVLALAFKNGEKGAYDAIYERHSQRVHSVCRRILQDPDDAREASQETFLKVYQSLPRFNGRYQMGAWIARIATNVCLDQIRSRGRRPSYATPIEELELDHDDVPDHDPESLFIRNSEGRKVRKILASLSPLHRAAIVLREFEGFSYQEIAATLGMTECQVKALLHRARRSFKRSWATSVAGALLPGRILERLRSAVPSLREPQSSATHMVEGSSSAMQVLNSCSIALQHCGQVLGERIVAAAAAVTVGTAAVASIAAPSSAGKESRPQVVDVVRSAASASVGSAPKRPRHRKPRTTTPVPQSSTAPAPAPSPSSTTASGSGQSSGSTAPPPAPPAPSSSPTPPPEPQGTSLSFSVDQPAPEGACTECQRPWSVVSESTTKGPDKGLHAFTQRLSGTADAPGPSWFRIDVEHSSSEARNHELGFFLWTKEGSYGYRASGSLTQTARTPWGGWSYTFRGTYSLTARPSRSEAMPATGSYSATVVYSSTRNRIVSASFSLKEDPS